MAERRFLVIETEKRIEVYEYVNLDVKEANPCKWVYTIGKPLPPVVNQAYQLVTKKEPL